ncbi:MULTISPECIES: porphobilinogen synthase [Methanobacterium]|jgi:porphobilinogen synthase|uniref:Delta-aminolevulinic acid dehydratase n=1 Tax=Methanobacterium formicicum TaxID=2162 RepID=A0A090JXZ1_METFO|nr:MULTISPECIES: porphobilinogen synthase [Methanobacterium]KUK75188.1 MAG: Delta-aminolevulinic acid dehydratase [Methanobacterium sp. 42_16]MDD4810969.1 porphobilinogen synthase [Methanobacterium formicicum]MDG3547512.1 porphobilinogen synthase [Methanobacterium formicicum]MDH2659307.1 porphobilinogen synthase [Methanobacterium formicicum]CEA14436.1 Delta-aminolevulinic acid dehydratase [Methanobacterium formicicum]
MNFPTRRMRRLRKTPQIRKILSETTLQAEDFIYPLFIKEELEEGAGEHIDTMPGQYRYSLEDAIDEAKRLEKLGLESVLLFGMPEEKDELGTSAYSDEGIVQQAVHRLKKETDLVVITDVCLCQYTTHGHCGIVENGKILNDESLRLLAKTALSHAEAGADIVAPSDMMDGRVGVIREMLDDGGFQDTLIMSYAAKYASSFYAPFRDAVCSSPSFGDRKTHQMSPANVEEALLEVELDLDEGADIIMVKPAMAYLDVIQRVKEEFRMPTAAYQVSGEYSMLRAGIEAQYLTNEAIYESLLSIKRAGADLIISHFAPDFLEGKLDTIC